MNQATAIPATHGVSVAGRVGAMAYGLAAYATFFFTILYLIGFTGGWVVTKAIDDGAHGPLWVALVVNALLIFAFGLQHEVMARPWFKAAWTRVIPKVIERSTFVLLASLILLATFWLWRPIGGVVWSVEGPWSWAFHAGAALGWVIVFGSTFIINHFDLFGLRQVTLHAMGKEYTVVGFKLRLFYKLCRHPLMLGFIIAFWSTPLMTWGHLYFAGLMTLYILVGIRFEERDLIAEHGDDYREYKRNVRGLVPLPKSGASGGGS